MELRSILEEEAFFLRQSLGKRSSCDCSLEMFQFNQNEEKRVKKIKILRAVLCKPELSNASMCAQPTRRQTALSVLTHSTAVHSLHTAQC